MTAKIKTMKCLFLLVMTTAMTLQLFGHAMAKPADRQSNTNSGTTWYVSNLGDDGNTCTDPTTPCSTIQWAHDKANPGDTIYISHGVYKSDAYFGVIYITKDITIAGGWNDNFTQQDGYSTLDGQGTKSVVRVYTNTVATLDRLNITNGYNLVGGGGINSYGNLTVNNSTINNNVAGKFGNSGGGGGAGISSWGEITLNNSSVTNNHMIYGLQGSGIYANGKLTLNNSTVSQNTGAYGNGIYLLSGEATLYNSTIVYNEKFGIDMYGGLVKLHNTILARNGQDECQINSGFIISLGYNLVGNGTNCFSAFTGDLVGTASNPIDPLIASTLTEPYGYYALHAGSPAINAGDPTSCPATDQRGMIRPQGARCDMGAYEYSVPGVAAHMQVAYGSNQTVGPLSPFRLPLAVFVSDQYGTPVANVDVTFTAPDTGASGTFTNGGTNITTVQTNEGGMAVSSVFTANISLGSYTVTASSDGISTEYISLENGGWFVTPTGDNGNTCNMPSQSCLTINGALEKSGAGDTILVSGGIYTTNTGDEVVLIEKDISISGGWNQDFTAQNKETVISGEGSKTGITNKYATSTLTNLVIKNSINSGVVNYDGDLTINNCLISDNTSSGMGGGINNYGYMTINNSVIKNNSAGDPSSSGGGGGAGIENYSGLLTLNNSSVINNKLLGGREGSGIHTNGNIVLNNSTISNNSGGDGNGLDITGTVTINNSTISHNSGRGIYNIWGHVTLQNTIVAQNGVSDCYNSPYYSGTMISLGYNLIGNGKSCGLTAKAGDKIGTEANPINPLISAKPMYHWGVHTLLAGSPAIDAANPATCLPTDQRGVSRPQGSACDIGSYEYGAAPGTAAFFEYYDGSNQVGYYGRTFDKKLGTYIVDKFGTPIGGIAVTFTAPLTGASGIFPDTRTNTVTVLTDSSGLAEAAFNANNESGEYTVSASTDGFANSVTFSLSNLPLISQPNLLQNGNFEDPISLGSYWAQTYSSTKPPICTFSECNNRTGAAGPRSGETWVWFGGVESPYTDASTIAQEVVIPQGPSHLRFYLWIGTVQADSDANNRVTVYVDYTEVFNANATQQSQYSSYKLVDIDLTSFADGASHKISIYGQTSGKLVTFNVDDISINNAVFGDVMPDHWAWNWIERLYNAKVTGGCNNTPLTYCPNSYVNRAQMAIFMLRTKYGAAYTPPAATGNLFSDVPSNYWAAPWIEQLTHEGITGGCGNGKYCPETTVTRDQMAVFLLRSLYGDTYSPPTATGTMFTDIPSDHWAAAWIEQLANEGITGGCGEGTYCPALPVTRAQMAVFLAKAFNLP